MRKCTFALLIVTMCFVGTASLASATTFTVIGDPGDGHVDVNGDIANLTDPSMRPGAGGGSAVSFVRGQASIFFFPLPTVSITSAEVRLSYLFSDNSPEFNLDLFGLGTRASATILSSDYYAGPTAGGTGTLLQADFLTPASSPGDAVASMGSYLQTLYDAGGVPLDQFLVLRVNPDIPLPEHSNPIRGYWFAAADNLTLSLQPELSITVPEPASFVLAAFGLIGLAGWGWRRKKR